VAYFASASGQKKRPQRGGAAEAVLDRAAPAAGRTQLFQKFHWDKGSNREWPNSASTGNWALACFDPRWPNLILTMASFEA
jgi:hypothetical protein